MEVILASSHVPVDGGSQPTPLLISPKSFLRASFVSRALSEYWRFFLWLSSADGLTQPNDVVSGWRSLLDVTVIRKTLLQVFSNDNWIIFFYLSSLLFIQPLQSCPTLCMPMVCSPSGSSVHGSLQAGILEWVAMPFSRGLNPDPLHCRQILYSLGPAGKPPIYPSPSIKQTPGCFLFRKQPELFPTTDGWKSAFLSAHLRNVKGTFLRRRSTFRGLDPGYRTIT